MPKSIIKPCEVMDKIKVWVPLKSSKGRICAGAVVPYPPGVPLITLGERIEEDLIHVIEYYVTKGNTLLGIKDNKILVLEEEHEKGITYYV